VGFVLVGRLMLVGNEWRVGMATVAVGRERGF
jgi:hypothetical protein